MNKSYRGKVATDELGCREVIVGTIRKNQIVVLNKKDKKKSIILRNKMMVTINNIS